MKLLKIFVIILFHITFLSAVVINDTTIELTHFDIKTNDVWCTNYINKIVIYPQDFNGSFITIDKLELNLVFYNQNNPSLLEWEILPTYFINDKYITNVKLGNISNVDKLNITIIVYQDTYSISNTYTKSLVNNTELCANITPSEKIITNNENLFTDHQMLILIIAIFVIALIFVIAYYIFKN